MSPLFYDITIIEPSILQLYQHLTLFIKMGLLVSFIAPSPNLLASPDHISIYLFIQVNRIFISSWMLLIAIITYTHINNMCMYVILVEIRIIIAICST